MDQAKNLDIPISGSDSRERLRSTPYTQELCNRKFSNNIVDGINGVISPLFDCRMGGEKNTELEGNESLLFQPFGKHDGEQETCYSNAMENFFSSPYMPSKFSAGHVNSLQDSGFMSETGALLSCYEDTLYSPLQRRTDISMKELQSPSKRFSLNHFETPKQLFSRTKINTLAEDSPACRFLGDGRNEKFSNCLANPVFPNFVQYTWPKGTKLVREEDCNFKTSTQYTWHIKTLTCPMPLHFKHTVRNHCGSHHFDIVGCLASYNLEHIIIKIFCMMSPKDIFRCSNVSYAWAKVCHSNQSLWSRIKALKRQYKTNETVYGSENTTLAEAIEKALLSTPEKSILQKDLSSGRSVLSGLQTRAQKTPMKCSILLPKTPSGKNFFVPAFCKFEHNQGVRKTLKFGETLQPCPNCGWTAKVYAEGTNKGQCYRYDCQFKFCASCKSHYHLPEECTEIKLSPMQQKGAISAYGIGTRKSKRRLKKRLLM